MNVYEPLRHPAAFCMFLITLFFPVLIGFLTLRRTKDQSDFFLGGRTMNRFVVALSAVSSGRSSWLVLGVSGMAYTMGVSAVWAVTGYIVVEMLQFVYIGRKLRRVSDSPEIITLLDYFEARFPGSRNRIRLTGAFIITIFITAYVAAQLNAGAKSLSAAMSIPFGFSLAAAALLILVYMIMGGYIAVAYNDVIRSVIMITGLVVFPCIGLAAIGGVDALLMVLSQLNPALIDPFSLGAGAIIGFLGIGLGSPGQPHIIVRYMSAASADHLRFSAVIGTVWNVLMAWGALFIGLIGRALIPDIGNLPGADSEMIYLVLSPRFFGPVFFGLLTGGIFAAILSTADSQLLVVSSTFVRDIFEKILNPGRTMDTKSQLRISRLVVLISGVASLLLALAADDLIFWLVLFAWGGLGASFGPSLIGALYWKRTSAAGIVASMITGTSMIIIWKLFLKASTGIYELIPAFSGASAVLVVVSLIMNRRAAPSGPSASSARSAD